MTQWTTLYQWFELRDTRKVIAKSDPRRRRLWNNELEPEETLRRLPRELHCIRFPAEVTRTVCGLPEGVRYLKAPSPRERKVLFARGRYGLYPAKGSKSPRCRHCHLSVRNWKRHGGAPVEQELRQVELPITWSRLCTLRPHAMRVLNGVAPLFGYESAWVVPIELYPDLLTEGIVAAEAMRI